VGSALGGWIKKSYPSSLIRVDTIFDLLSINTSAQLALASIKICVCYFLKRKALSQGCIHKGLGSE
jgi:hypothetical protein